MEFYTSHKMFKQHLPTRILLSSLEKNNIMSHSRYIPVIHCQYEDILLCFGKHAKGYVYHAFSLLLQSLINSPSLTILKKTNQTLYVVRCTVEIYTFI